MLYNNILPKIKDKVVFITEGRNEWERRTIHSRAGKQTGKYKDWTKIIDEKGNIENIDWRSIKLWKRDLAESNKVFFYEIIQKRKKLKKQK